MFCRVNKYLITSYRCVIINEANRKKLRVGDTIIIENKDPLGEDVQFLEDYS